MKNTKWLALGGLSLGWLVGLSVSPILETVLTPVVALAATATAALSGINWKGSESPIVADVRPLGILLVCIALGATSGLSARYVAPEFIGRSIPSLNSPVGEQFGLKNADDTLALKPRNPILTTRAVSFAIKAMDADMALRKELGHEYIDLRNELVNFRDEQLALLFSSETIRTQNALRDIGKSIGDSDLPNHIKSSLKYAMGGRSD